MGVAGVPGTGGDVASMKAISAMKALLQSRDEEIKYLKEKVCALEADLENALSQLSSLAATGQKKSVTPSQNISNMSQQHLASHAYLLQQMSINPAETILGVSGVSSVSGVSALSQSSTSSSQQTSGFNASYPMYGVNNSQSSPVRQQGGVSVAAAGSAGTSAGAGVTGVTGVAGVAGVTVAGVSDAIEGGAQPGADDFDSAFAHLGLVESLLD